MDSILFQKIQWPEDVRGAVVISNIGHEELTITCGNNRGNFFVSSKGVVIIE